MLLRHNFNQQLMKEIIFVLTLLIISVNISSQDNVVHGNRNIQNYDNKNYNTPEEQTWAITQDLRGIMYFGNNAGVLEFDGNTWKLIEVSNKSTVRSLAVDKSKGTIYVGAVGDFGFLKADRNGSLKYSSLIEKVDENYRDFEDVWQIYVLEQQVILRTSKYLFLLKNDEIKTITTSSKFHRGFVVNNQFYIREVDVGLHLLTKDGLKLVTNSEIFSKVRIYTMLPFNDGKILIGSDSKGIFIYSPNSNSKNKFVKHPKFGKVSDFLVNNQLYCGVKYNNRFVFGTFQGGVIVVNQNGDIVDKINKQSGLQDPTVLSLFVDDKKNIWAGLNNGISYIIYNSPFTIYTEQNGLIGTVLSAKQIDSVLYIGTSRGLFREVQENKFKLIENTKGYCWSISKKNGKFLLGHYNGFYEFDDGGIKNIVINTPNVWKFEKIKNENYMLASTRNGLQLAEFNGNTWKFRHQIQNFDGKARYMQISSDSILWVSRRDKGVYKLKVNKKLDSIVQKDFYNSSHGLPADNNNFIFKITNNKAEIVFGTEKGIYEYDEPVNKFYPSKRFYHFSNNTGVFNLFEQDDNGNIYYQQGKEKGVLLFKKNSPYQLVKTPFLKFEALYIESISIIDSTRVLFCSTDGVILYNPQVKPNYDVSYSTRIRQVFANDSLVYGGSKNEMSPIELSYKYNNLQFAYAALFFEDENKTIYSTYLEGYSNKWSSWSNRNIIDYTNLPEGGYVFKVKAKNIYGKESEIDEFKFVILTPWYRTYLAYLGYFVVAILSIYALIRLNSRRLVKEKKKLEEIVISRTSEIIQQKEEIQTQAEKLITINENLLELNEFKQGLTSMIVHDLKNPLNLIINTPESIDYEKQNSIMRQSGKQMLNMVLNILDVDKFEDVKMVLDLEEKQFVLIANYAIKQIQFLSEQKNISIKNQIDQNLVTKVEEQIAERILVNLLTNAIKYTPLNGSITLSSRPKSETFVQIEVTDTGEGIPKEKLHLVFQKFGQIVAKKSGGVRSTGLGLTFCKLAVEAHGGEIGVISEIGKGTTFWFTLQLSQKKHVTLKSVEKEEEIEQEIIIFTEAERNILEPIINRLNEFSVYETGDIEEIVAELKYNKEENIQKWLEQLNDSLVYLNQSKYQELLKIT